MVEARVLFAELLMVVAVRATVVGPPVAFSASGFRWAPAKGRFHAKAAKLRFVRNELTPTPAVEAVLIAHLRTLAAHASAWCFSVLLGSSRGNRKLR